MIGLFDHILQAGENVQTGLGLRHVDPELMANGLVGSAIVKAVKPTGIGFGQDAFADAVLAFELEIELPDREPYAVGLQQRVPHIYEGAVIPGVTVAVRVDPADLQRVAIDFDKPSVPAGGAAAADPLGELERLAKLHAQGVITDAELAEQKQRLLGEM